MVSELCLKRIAVRISLAPETISDGEIRELAGMPEYQSFESFVQEVTDEMEETFNLSDVKILVWSMYTKWVKAGRPDPKDPLTSIKPMDNKQVIDVLTKEWGLTYVPPGSKPGVIPPSLIKKTLKAPGVQTPRAFDRRNRFPTV